MPELLLAPLEELLIGGGDERLALDPVSGTNRYGCRPYPSDAIGLGSSTASGISRRAFARASRARSELVNAAVAVGLEAAFGARLEAMRAEINGCFGLPADDVDVVFSPSGTHAQSCAMQLVRSLLGGPLTTIVCASDQTGSGIAFAARGQHFSACALDGAILCKGEPMAGIGRVNCVELPALDGNGEFRARHAYDEAVLKAIESALTAGSNVLVLAMDSSKLGWRAPSDACLDEVARRWPDRVRVVVDACQARLGRGRIASLLDRGHLVIVTGSKFFAGPSFSGALLVPSSFPLESLSPGPGFDALATWCTQSDWPGRFTAIQAQLSAGVNIGQWLRWEAALEEIAAYYAAPEAFRRRVIAGLGQGIAHLLSSSNRLRPLVVPHGDTQTDLADEEHRLPTIFAAVPLREGAPLRAADCALLYRALAHDARHLLSDGAAWSDQVVAAQSCIVGQPVSLSRRSDVSALRFCISARHVSEAWCAGGHAVDTMLQRELERVAAVIRKLELLIAGAEGCANRGDVQ